MSSEILEPTDLDVLFGRTPSFYRHPGNLFLKTLVQQRVDEFEYMRKNRMVAERSTLITSLVEAVQARGGRFLKQSKQHGSGNGPRSTSTWEIVTREKARHKVGHMLRDHPLVASQSFGNGKKKKKLPSEDGSGQDESTQQKSPPAKKARNGGAPAKRRTSVQSKRKNTGIAGNQLPSKAVARRAAPTPPITSSLPSPASTEEEDEATTNEMRIAAQNMLCLATLAVAHQEAGNSAEQVRSREPPRHELLHLSKPSTSCTHSATPILQRLTCVRHGSKVALSVERRFQMGVICLHPVCPLCLNHQLTSSSDTSMVRADMDALCCHYERWVNQFSLGQDWTKPIQALQSRLLQIRDQLGRGQLEFETDLPRLLDDATLGFEESLLDEPLQPPSELERLKRLRNSIGLLSEQLSDLCPNTGLSAHNTADALNVALGHLGQLIIQLDTSDRRHVDDTTREGFLEEIDSMIEDLMVLEQRAKGKLMRFDTVKLLVSQLQTLWRTYDAENDDPAATWVSFDSVAAAKLDGKGALLPDKTESSEDGLEEGVLITCFSKPGGKSLDDVSVGSAVDSSKAPFRDRTLVPLQESKDAKSVVTHLGDIAMFIWEQLNATPSRQLKLSQQLLEETAMSIKAAAKSFSVDPHVMRAACTAIESFSRFGEGGIGMIVKFGCLNILAAAMKRFPMDEYVQMCGCRSLVQAASFDTTRKSAVLLGFDLLVSCMQSLPGEPDIQALCCNAFGRMAATNGLSAVAVAVDSRAGMNLVVQAMLRYPCSLDVLRNGCAAIGGLSIESSKSGVASGAAIEIVLQVVKRHSADSDIAKNATFALAQLASRHPQQKIKIATMGGLNLVLSAVRPNVADMEACFHGCLAILSLISESLDSPAIWLDCIDVVTAIMHNHLTEPDLQHNGIRILGRLASQQRDAQVRSVAATSMELIADVMRRHMDVQDLQADACRAIGVMAMDTTTNQDRAASCGAISVVLCAMRKHLVNPSVQGNACFALGCCAGSIYKSQIATAGGVESMLFALREHQPFVNVAIEATNALGKLCENNEEIKACVAKNRGIDLLVSTMKRHESNPTVVQNSCAMLSLLAATSSENAIGIAREGGIEAISEAMKKHPTNGGVQDEASILLGHLAAKSAANQTSIRNNGGVFLIESALKRSSVAQSREQDVRLWALEHLRGTSNRVLN